MKMCNMCDLSQNSKKKKKWGGGEIWELLILSPRYRGDENDFIIRETGKTATEALVGDFTSHKMHERRHSTLMVS